LSINKVIKERKSVPFSLKHQYCDDYKNDWLNKKSSNNSK